MSVSKIIGVAIMASTWVFAAVDWAVHHGIHPW